MTIFEIVKFSPDGVILWRYHPPANCLGVHCEKMLNSHSLWGGAVYASTEGGVVFAVSMDTGQELWSTMYVTPAYKLKRRFFFEPVLYENSGFVMVNEGVVVVGSYEEV